MKTIAFIITIDTEGDNIWQSNHTVGTLNAHCLSRFQSLCENFNFKPVWLVNYEMIKDPVFIEFAKDVITRNQGEIGMHLHAWNSPPEYNLTGNDWYWKPYLIEFPETIMYQKVLYMTNLLEKTFNTKIISHRAGRWALDSRYANILIKFGYRVDCSVTPRINWSNTKGSPHGSGGMDYRHFPNYAYFIDADNIAQSGNQPLLEVPVSINYKHPLWYNKIKKCFSRLLNKNYVPSVNWLRPNGNNITQMINLSQWYIAQGSDYLEFMLHSSELLPGGSPTFKDETSIENLYKDLRLLFKWLSTRTHGMTLMEFWKNKNAEKFGTDMYY